MLIGKLSGEWLLVAGLGLVVTAAIAMDAPNRVLMCWEYWATGAVVLLLNVFVFRLLGRTTTRKVESNHAAARGHPRLTIMILFVHIAIWTVRPIGLVFG